MKINPDCTGLHEIFEVDDSVPFVIFDEGEVSSFGEVVPWNKGKKNTQVPWNKGLSGAQTMSAESKQYLRELNIGKKLSEDHKRKIGEANSVSCKGRVPWNKGSKYADEKRSSLGMTYAVITPEGESLTITNMRKFCLENGLSPSGMCTAIKNNKPHRGYRASVMTEKELKV